MKNKKKSRTKFNEIEVPVNSEIVFINNSELRAIVVADNHVIFAGKKDSLSDITTTLLKEIYGASEESRVNGFLYWSYQGEILANRRLRIEKERLIRELQTYHEI